MKLKYYSLNIRPSKSQHSALEYWCWQKSEKWGCPRELCRLESSVPRSSTADSTAGSTHHTTTLQAPCKLKTAQILTVVWQHGKGCGENQPNDMAALILHLRFDSIFSGSEKESLLEQLRKFPFLKFNTRNSLLNFTTVFITGRYSATTDLLINISFCTSDLPKAVETNQNRRLDSGVTRSTLIQNH